MKKVLLLFFTISLLGSSQTYAIYPAYNTYGWLLLYPEGELSSYIKAKAVMHGVEKWYNTYEWMIDQYIRSGSFYQYIYMDGRWQNVYITPNVLAYQIWRDYSLEYSGISSSVCNAMQAAIEADDQYNYSGTYTSHDPIGVWKWRTSYMEGMYAENDFTTCNGINANCWGTADYLAMDYEWRDEYVSAFPSGASNWGDKFPHIYLDGGKYYWGGQYNEYCLDDDLNPYENSRAIFKGHRSGTSGSPQPENLLSAFDVIRLAENPIDPSSAEYWELEIDGTNVGENLHGVAYICTDRAHKAWIYEKHNYGCTMYCPYGINILGDDQWTSPVSGIGMYNYSYCSFFKKYDSNKIVFADTWDMNWAGITE